MEKDRVIRIVFMTAVALSMSTAATPEVPPSPRLPYSAVGETDFRGCDRDWNTPVDVSPAKDPEE